MGQGVLRRMAGDVVRIEFTVTGEDAVEPVTS